MRFFAFFLSAPCACLLALPSAPQVLDDKISFSQLEANFLKIDAPENAQIHWETFSIQESETVQFCQPSADSKVVNIVTSLSPSQIMGNLISNGVVLLYNQNGILFGNKSQINVGSLIASTFKHGELNASGGELYCSGKIFAEESIHLIGERIALLDGASLIAPSGMISIGGERQGPDRQFPSSAQVFIAPTAHISCSALENGNGGSLFIWSEESTQFYGSAEANGGTLLGDGGFIDVSSRGYLDVSGIITASSPLGKSGSILFDPTGLTISAGGNASVTGVTPFMPTTAGVTGNLNNATLQAALGGSHVVVQTIAGGIGAGNIAWASGANVNWGTNNTLTLLAHNNITVQSNVQNNVAGNTGAITLVAGWDGITTANFATTPSSYGNNTGGFGADITVGNSPQAVRVYSEMGAVSCFGNNVFVTGGTAVNAGTSIGSRFATTTVMTRNNLTIQGAAPDQSRSQLGFRSVDATVTTGPINVDVGGVLNILAGTQQRTQAQLGHIGGGDPGTPNPGSANAPITVVVRNLNNAATACLLQAGQVGNLPYTSAQIGHGGQISRPAIASGAINVTVLTGNVVAIRGQLEGAAQIGHGAHQGTFVTTTINSNMNVQVLNGNFSAIPSTVLSASNGQFGPSGIFHHGQNITGSINVFVSGNITLAGQSLNPNLIGTHMTLPNPANFNCPIQVCCGGNLNMGVSCNVGHSCQVLAGSLTTVTGDVQVGVRGNITLNPIRRGANDTPITYIGSSSVLPSVPITSATLNSRLFVTCGGDLTVIGCALPLNVNGRSEIFGLGDVYVAVNGNALFRGDANNATISSRFENSILRFWVGGNINFQNGASGGNAYLGAFPGLVSIAPASRIIGGSVDARAGGDLRLAQNIDFYNPGLLYTPTVPNIYVEGGASFAAGQLWSFSGGAITSVTGVATSLPCSPFPSGSSGVAADGLGTVWFDTARYSATGTLITPAASNLLMRTRDGNISVISQARYQDGDLNYAIAAGAPSDLRMGGATNQLQLDATLNGSILVSSYRDTYISNTVNSTNGSITVITQNNMILEPTAIVQAGGNIDLVVDNQMPVSPLIGTGFLTTNATSVVNSTNGYIRLYTALQSLNAIDPNTQFFTGGSPSTFTAGELFVDTAGEQWCTYYPSGSQGIPFRVFYKDCLEIIVEQAQVIVSEILFEFDQDPNFPYYGLDDYLGAPTRFIIGYDLYSQDDPNAYDSYSPYLNRPFEKYYLRRGNFVLVNSKLLRRSYIDQYRKWRDARDL